MKTKNALQILSGILITLFFAAPGRMALAANPVPAPSDGGVKAAATAPAQAPAPAPAPANGMKNAAPAPAQSEVKAEKPTEVRKGTVSVDTKSQDGVTREPIIYTIVKDDTLWGISEKFFNDPLKWPKLWKQNDYITNPHLIFPGNKVAITENGIEAVKTAEKKSEAAPIVEKAASVAEKAAPLNPEQLPVEEVQSHGDNVVMLEPEAGAAVQTEEVSAEQKEVSQTPVSKDLERNGFITQKELGEVGSILKQKDNRIMIGTGDRVYMSFKSREGLKPGALFSIFILGDRVIHPKTGDKLGYLIDVLGVLEIKAVGDIVEAQVVKAYKEIYPGNNVMPYADKAWDKKIVKNSKDIGGYIVMTLDGKNAVAKGDAVYVDKGLNDGLVQGNMMRIYRHNVEVTDPYTGENKELPFVELGKLVVVDSEQETSAAIITESSGDIYKGDLVSTVTK